MIILDTSVLVDSLTGPRPLASALRSAVRRGERIRITSMVLYEWLRGPRLPDELADQEALCPSETAIPFGPREAAVSARLYRSVGRPRSREIDIAIAGCAVCHEAELWTVNRADFDDLPDLRLADIR
jgi:predicted nucleic acid-binding protein